MNCNLAKHMKAKSLTPLALSKELKAAGYTINRQTIEQLLSIPERAPKATTGAAICNHFGVDFYKMWPEKELLKLIKKIDA